MPIAFISIYWLDNGILQDVSAPVLACGAAGLLALCTSSLYCLRKRLACTAQDLLSCAAVTRSVMVVTSRLMHWCSATAMPLAACCGPAGCAMASMTPPLLAPWAHRIGTSSECLATDVRGGRAHAAVEDVAILATRLRRRLFLRISCAPG